MARISLDPPRTLSYRIAARFSRRRYGTVLDPVAAVAHNAPVGLAYGLFELQVERWRKLDTGLKDLAVMMAAATIGCSWCMDFGYWESVTKHDVPAEKIRAVPQWRDSDVFSELERLVLEYAEAMTATPPSVTDDLTQRLRDRLSDAQLVELTAIVAVENLRSRINAALGLTSQGFKDQCEIPAAASA
jgi:alkylhydroperoxidase family enzyme